MDDHKWAQISGSADACQCVRCGMVASNTAIVAGVGVPTAEGWTVGEFAAALPGCDEMIEHMDIDAEMARLLAGEFGDV